MLRDTSGGVIRLNLRKTCCPPLKSVMIDEGFWGYYRKLACDVIIPYQWQALNDAIDGIEPSRCVRNFRLAARKNQGLPLEDAFDGRVFQDSDLAKWLEAVAGRLVIAPDAQLESQADELIELIGAAQEPDGYLNTYGTLVLGDRRWHNLRDEHELYCSGHLIEAAVAYFEATGKRRFLDIMEKNVACITSVFGTEAGKLRGYPGHPEIELALVRLYQVTRNPRHLALAEYFIRERGRQPLYFEEEVKRHGVPRNWMRTFSDPALKYNQSHRPLTEQQTLDGHAVRALYLLSGLIDVAAETGSEDLMQSARRLWHNCVDHRMYVTGGVGSTHHGEAFTFDNHLPNETAYAETCASIALIFAARRMLEVETRAEYADVMERALYNTCIGSVQLDGMRFLYVNPLQVWPEASKDDYDHWHVKSERQKWFGTACCPPNLARLLTSLGQYAFTVGDNTICQHLYVDCRAEFTLSDGTVTLVCSTRYPADGVISLRKAGPACRLALRIPGWCRAYVLTVNGRPVVQPVPANGYVLIDCPEGALEIDLELTMQPQRVTCHPAVPENIGKVCLQRGPLVYCLEEADNRPELWRLLLPADSNIELKEAGWPGYIPNLQADGCRLANGRHTGLYSLDEQPALEPVRLTFVPYYAWSNRSPGEMLVWLRELAAAPDSASKQPEQPE